MEKYIVLGASPNPIRHSYKAVKSLIRRNKYVIPIGFRKGKISGIEIQKGTPDAETGAILLLYVGAKRQTDLYNYILDKLKPSSIVFNPGTENDEFQKMAEEKGVKTIVGCALVMINGGQI